MAEYYLTEAQQFDYDILVELENDAVFMNKMKNYNEASKKLKRSCEPFEAGKQVFTHDKLHLVAWWKEGTPAMAFNQGMFKKDHPDLYNEYYMQRAAPQSLIMEKRVA